MKMMKKIQKIKEEYAEIVKEAKAIQQAQQVSGEYKTLPPMELLYSFAYRPI